MEVFNEQILYNAIVSVWGEHGAHAELYRDICKKAGLEIQENVEVETMEDLVWKLYYENGRSKINTIKALRWSEEAPIRGLGLKEAKNIVDGVIGKG